MKCSNCKKEGHNKRKCPNAVTIVKNIDTKPKGEVQKQLSKEFVRRWLIENGFQGKEGQAVPEMTPAKVKEISDRYIELYEKIIAEKFIPVDNSNIAQRIETNVIAALKNLS